MGNIDFIKLSAILGTIFHAKSFYETFLKTRKQVDFPVDIWTSKLTFILVIEVIHPKKFQNKKIPDQPTPKSQPSTFNQIFLATTFLLIKFYLGNFKISMTRVLQF